MSSLVARSADFVAVDAVEVSVEANAACRLSEGEAIHLHLCEESNSPAVPPQ